MCIRDSPVADRAVAVGDVVEGAHDAGLHVEQRHLLAARADEERRRMARGAVRYGRGVEVDDAHKERGERLDAAEPEEKLVQAPHHARGREALPGVGPERGLHRGRDR